MRVEGLLLLHVGYSPKKVSEILEIPLGTVYYYNKELKKGINKIKELNGE